jgi:formylglycine-generating enzyme required for sulfatase activity
MYYSYKSLLCVSLLIISNSLNANQGFALIPHGQFTMGDSLDGIWDASPRLVDLDAFIIGKNEVTKSEWDSVANWAVSNGYTDLAIGRGKAVNHPVQTVS